MNVWREPSAKPWIMPTRDMLEFVEIVLNAPAISEKIDM
jgi:hypothetical protein